MARSRSIAMTIFLVVILMGTWGGYSLWPSPKKYLIAVPPKLAIHAEWPVIDCGAKNIATSPRCSVPPAGSNKFLLKIRVTNLPKPEQGLFIAFYPILGTKDAKENVYYGGAMFGQGSQKGGVWEFEGEASVVTFRDQRMRAVLQCPGEPDFAEVLVDVEPETPK